MLRNALAFLACKEIWRISSKPKIWKDFQAYKKFGEFLSMAEGKEDIGREESKEENAASENSESDKKEERIRKTAYYYYQRKDIKKILLEEGTHREVVPRYYDGFGRRPDMLQYENDLRGWVDKGATSFHCSEERWKNPLEISEDNIDELRIGWDLLLDIDSKFLDYSKIAAQLIIKALNFHNMNSVGLKYSGNKGFHIIVPWEAFPKELNGSDTAKLFPQAPRIMAQYLNSFIREELIDEINKLTQKNKYVKGEEKPGDFADKVMPDIILVSPRHLFRMPYSLHEKTCLASIVIKKEQIKNFHPGWANPSRVFPKPFLPNPEKDEAKNLITQAFDWWSKRNLKIEAKSEKAGKNTGRETILKDVSPEFYPPCIKCALNGVKQDGRKRALFIMLNFLKSLNLSREEIEKKLGEWNKKNYKPLKEGYVKAQLIWHKRQKPMLPPNCDKSYYKDIGICFPDSLCGRIKNPVNYVSAKVNFGKNTGRKKARPKKEEPEFKIMRRYSG
jgi:DNA primase catalytic subunit